LSRFQRTTKILAQRIDLHYFQLPHPFRRRLFFLSIIVPVVALAWLAWHQTPWSNPREFSSPGPLSQAHALFGNRCELCHTATGSKFRVHASDHACLTCHDGPVHNANQEFTPQCSTCHLEHRGPVLLTAVRDTTCTQCHRTLRLRTGTPHFQNVAAFRPGRHPDFASRSPGFVDPGTIKFSHQVHLDSLNCDACHIPAAQPELSAKDATFLGAAGTLRPSESVSSARGAYMAPVRFADHCVACHSDKLEFDKRILDSVPHDTPEVIHTAILKAAPAGGKLVADLERALWKEKCAYCHSLTFGQGELPKVVSSSIPRRWLLHASFTHAPHSMFSCQGCHTSASTSKSEADVLLPAVAICQKCHQPDDAANANCSECHAYHDWKSQRQEQLTFDAACLLEKGKAESCKSTTREEPPK
jgi:hypothetical protein